MAGEKFCVDCKYCLEVEVEGPEHSDYFCIRKVEPKVDLVTGRTYYSEKKYCYTLRESQNALECGEIGRYFEPKDL